VGDIVSPLITQSRQNCYEWLRRLRQVSINPDVAADSHRASCAAASE
jgi:hypothetical protein